MRYLTGLYSLCVAIAVFSGGCSYKFCDIGPVCHAEHIFLPKALTVETDLSDEELGFHPLKASFKNAFIDYAGRRTMLSLDTSNAFVQPDLGVYIFTSRARAHGIKFANLLLAPPPQYPHDQVPMPHDVRLCLEQVNYASLIETPLLSDGKRFERNGYYAEWCLDFSADKLGAWIDCGDGCPPDATIP